MVRSTLTRSSHDLGLAAWFGGTLANAVALNRAASLAPDTRSTGLIATDGWDRWTQVNAAAIALHLGGSVGQLVSNAGRVAGQSGVGSMAVAKTALTVAALGVTGYARLLGRRLSAHDGDVPAESGTEPAEDAPSDVAAAQRQLAVLQWAVPALTGALVVLSSFAGEQQRPTEVQRGFAKRFAPSTLLARR